MPYIIRDNKVVYVQLGSQAMMTATNCYMTEREATAKLEEGKDGPTSAQMRSRALAELTAAECEARDKKVRLKRAEAQFQLRLTANSVPLEEIMEVWRKAYLS